MNPQDDEGSPYVEEDGDDDSDSDDTSDDDEEDDTPVDWETGLPLIP